MFVQVRPSPWRQAVDLGNMMLVLAVRTEPERVYLRALNYFTPAELAEAFAATRGVASPTQLRASMKNDPRDLLGVGTAVRRKLTDTERALQMGRAARESVQHHFLGPHHLGRYFEVMRRLLGHHVPEVTRSLSGSP